MTEDLGRADGANGPTVDGGSGRAPDGGNAPTVDGGNGRAPDRVGPVVDGVERALAAGPGTAPPADAMARLAAAADAAGLLDVAWATTDSPLGRLVLAATPAGLVRVAYEGPNGGLDAVLAVLAARLSPRVVEAPARLDAVRRQLDEYFAGRRQAFDVPVDWSLVAGPFGRAVLREATLVPFGRVTTYGALARALGRPSAARATGGALGANPVPVVVPCHRVLRSGGGLGGYTGGLDLKQALLRLEGVIA